MVGPSESMGINPVIKSDSTVDMFVFARIEMPGYGSVGLYDIDLNSGWECIESAVNGDKWVSVYHYNEVLTPGTSRLRWVIS